MNTKNSKQKDLDKLDEIIQEEVEKDTKPIFEGYEPYPEGPQPEDEDQDKSDD